MLPTFCIGVFYVLIFDVLVYIYTVVEDAYVVYPSRSVVHIHTDQLQCENIKISWKIGLCVNAVIDKFDRRFIYIIICTISDIGSG